MGASVGATMPSVQKGGPGIRDSSLESGLQLRWRGGHSLIIGSRVAALAETEQRKAVLAAACSLRMAGYPVEVRHVPPRADSQRLARMAGIVAAAKCDIFLTIGGDLRFWSRIVAGSRNSMAAEGYALAGWVHMGAADAELDAADFAAGWKPTLVPMPDPEAVAEDRCDWWPLLRAVGPRVCRGVHGLSGADDRVGR